MLLSLSIADFVLVERLTLEFDPGFSVLTGETGAGKSILLDALALVLGERADAQAVRQGASRAEVAATFDIAARPGLADWLTQQDLAGEADDATLLLLRRVVETGGRSRAFINGRPATAQQLKEAGEHLVDIHGQHAHYSLLKAAEQRRLLDAFAGSSALAAELADAWRAWRDTRAQREAAEARGSEIETERAELAATVEELAALSFSAEGWQALQDEQRRLAHAAELAQGAQLAADALDNDEASALAPLRGARARLAALAEIDPSLTPPRDALDEAAALLHDTARELRRYGERVELDPSALAQAEARLAAVQAAARKHHIRPEAIPDVLHGARTRLAELGAGADLALLAAQEAAQEAACRALAARLGAVRAAAAAQLGEAVSAAMQQLAMAGGQFCVDLPPAELGAHGQEDIVFMVAPHAGQALQPLARTASGGELSRIGLALQSILSAVSGAPTLIFDEVDAGIGGSVAEIVGRMLAAQGASRQVLCVTHLAQVAARATAHFQVSKHEAEGAARTRVSRLDATARIEEIARMLGGVKITTATRQHAEEMLRG